MKKMKNTRDLREFLTNQMQLCAEGKVEMDRSKGVANLAQQVYNTLNLEMRMALARAKLTEGAKVEPVSFD